MRTGHPSRLVGPGPPTARSRPLILVVGYSDVIVMPGEGGRCQALPAGGPDSAGRPLDSGADDHIRNRLLRIVTTGFRSIPPLQGVNAAGNYEFVRGKYFKFPRYLRIIAVNQDRAIQAQHQKYCVLKISEVLH